MLDDQDTRGVRSEASIEDVIKSTPLTVLGNPRPFLAFKPMLLSEGVTESLKERSSTLRWSGLPQPTMLPSGSSTRAVEITSDYDGVALLHR